MELDFLIFLSGIGIIFLVITLLIIFGIIKPSKRTPGVYHGPRVPRTKIWSSKYGEDMVLGGSIQYGKPILELQETGAVTDIVPWENCFPLNPDAHVFGDVMLWVHFHDSYDNDNVRKKLSLGVSASQKRRMSQLIAHNKSLQRECDRLRVLSREQFVETAQAIGIAQKSVTPFNPGLKRKKGSDSEDNYD